MKYEDSRQAWVTVVGGCLTLFISLGMNRINALLFVSLMEQGNLNRGTASWPFSLPGAAVIVMSPVTGFLSGRFSPAYLSSVGTVIFCLGSAFCFFSTNIYFVSIFYGLLRGFGLALMCTTIPVVINNSFKKHRATAMGLTTSGIPLAGMLLPILTQFFLLEYGLRGTFLLLAAVCLHGLVGSILLKWYYQKRKSTNETRSCQDKPKGESESDRLITSHSKSDCYGTNNEASHVVECSKDITSTVTPEYTPNSSAGESENQKRNTEATGKKPVMSLLNIRLMRKLFTNRVFYIVVLNQAINVFILHTFSQVIIDYMADKGISYSLSLYMLTVSSLGEIAGSICLGWIPDRKILSTENHTALFTVLSVGMIALMVNSTNFTALMISYFFLGACQGSTGSINFVHFAKRMSREEMTLAVSFGRSINGVAVILRSPVIGAFRDTLGSYDIMFYVLGGTLLPLAVAWLVEGIVTRKTRQKDVTS